MTYLIVLPITLLCACAISAEPQNYRTTPVPILKQINRHNDDGSYSYGYEAADGTFKIETKYPTGEVFGKYGYVGDDGKVREIEYGASRRGFEPAGTGINVPPPTISQSGPQDNSLDYDDGQYREDPAKYYHKKSQSNFGKTYHNYRFAATTQAPPPPQQYYNPQPQPYYNPNPTPTPYNPYQNYNGHPATNVDLRTGSYSLSYSG